MINVYFCFPFKGVGGVPVLFVRIAEFLAGNGMAKCFLIDYADGYMSKTYNSDLVTLLEYSEMGEVAIPDDAVVILQSMTPWSIFPKVKFSKNTKILFWNCHPLNLVPLLPGFRQLTTSYNFLGRLILNSLLLSYKRKCRDFLSLLIQRNAILFMDGTNLKTSERFLATKVETPLYLPIPSKIDSVSATLSKREKSSNSLHFLWIGRIVDFKYYALKRFVSDLNDLTLLEQKIHFTIVGDGDYLSKLKQDVMPLGGLNFKFISYVPSEQIDAFIVNNADILVAMGTSALEGAKLGIPTLVLDFAYNQIQGEYLYRWMHKTRDYNLGELLFDKDSKNPNGMTLLAIVQDYLERAEEISQSENSYFQRNHDLLTVSKLLLSFIEKANLRYFDLSKSDLIEKGLVYSFFIKLRQFGTRLLGN